MQEIPNEKAMIEEILQRRRLKQTPIPAERMQVFKEKLGEEIARNGTLSHDFVSTLLQRLKSGELWCLSSCGSPPPPTILPR